MKIMTPVWILTGLWGSYLGLLVYLLAGRSPERNMETMNMSEMKTDMNMDMDMDMGKDDDMGNMKMDMKMDMDMDKDMASSSLHPKPVKVCLSTLHCGAGCTLADLIGESLTIGIPLVIAGSALVGQWTIDYILALVIGILFQYAAIQPMLHLKTGKALLRALRIDFLSLTSWQIGMYGWMAITSFLLYPQGLSKGSLEFWFMMQIAMFCGFLTAYPVNWFLIKKGIKPSM